MMILINKPITVEVQYLEVILQSYSVYSEDWEFCGSDDYNVMDLPFYVKENDTFVFFIDLNEGRIVNWAEDDTLNVCAKVRDEGEYWLLDDNFAKIIKSNDKYVPKMLDTRGDGGGDYIQFEVDENGYINNWKLDLDKFDAVWAN